MRVQMQYDGIKVISARIKSDHIIAPAEGEAHQAHGRPHTN